MATTAEQIRSWRGTALLGYGFRPFFLSAAVFAALAMTIWIGALTGLWQVPSAFGPVEWHVHEFLWGYLSAVVAGFMLTAVPNWTGRLPIVGPPLGLLWSSWALGRVAIFCSANLPPAAVAAADLLFPILLILMLGREIVAGRNWRNLKVLVIAAVLFSGNAVFHWQAIRGEVTQNGLGVRMGLAGAILLIVLVGGRIIPSFTRNWLARLKPGQLPAAFGNFDKATVVASILALGFWVAAPEFFATGWLLLVAGVLNLIRLFRWSGWRSLAEPLVSILHIGYFFVPLGFALLGASILLGEEVIRQSAALHAWTAGAILLMTLAVMTRASLGHSGMPLMADKRISAIYVFAIAAALSRLAAGLFPAETWLLDIAGAGWILAFVTFTAVYAPLFVKPRVKA